MNRDLDQTARTLAPVRRLASLGACAALLIGCSAEVDVPHAEGRPEALHLLLSIERSQAVDDKGSASANALAGFAALPSQAAPEAVLSLTGLGLDLPPPGQCRSGGERSAEVPLAAVGPVEFVAAGDVELSTEHTTTVLHPHAFPGTGSVASGVLYTSPDQSAEPLPTQTGYTLTTRGSESLPALSLEATAPASLAALQVGEVAFAELEGLKTDAGIELGWGPGAGGDLVYVELLSYDASAEAVCVFADEDGAGVIPADVFQSSGLAQAAGSVRLAVHRLRRLTLPSAGGTAEVRFDFEQTRAVELHR